MNFRKANPLDILDVKKLWEEVFGDAEDYIRRFINYFDIENCYVCEINNKLVAMAFAITTTLTSPSLRIKSAIERMSEGWGSLCKNKKTSIKYIYACATHPDFQSQGIMKKLLDTIYEDACRENFAGIFLHAANPDLANYYQKLGFDDFFFRDHFFYHRFNHKEHEDVLQNAQRANAALLNLCALAPLRERKINLISPENYCKKRVEKLKNQCFIDWHNDFFQFLNETGTQFCEYENTIFSFKTSFNNIIVDELLGDTPHEQIAQLLFEEFPDFDVVHIRSIGNEFCCGQIKCCNLVNENLSNGWLGFAME